MITFWRLHRHALQLVVRLSDAKPVVANPPDSESSDSTLLAQAEPAAIQNPSGDAQPRPWLTVTGQLVDENGKPAAGIPVRMKCQEQREEQITDAQEKFSFRNWKSESFAAHFEATSPDRSLIVSQVKSLTSDIWRTPAVIDLKLAPAVTTTVRVVDQAGKPVADARVGWDDSSYRETHFLTDQEGRRKSHSPSPRLRQ